MNIEDTAVYKEVFDKDLIEYSDSCSPIYWSENNTMRIDSCLSYANTTDPYFRVYKGYKCSIFYNSNLSKLCRISMMKPEYIDGVGSDMILSEYEIEELIEILESKSSLFPDDNITNWQGIIKSYNNDVYKQDPLVPLPLDLPMPDYRQLLK